MICQLSDHQNYLAMKVCKSTLARLLRRLPSNPKCQKARENHHQRIFGQRPSDPSHISCHTIKPWRLLRFQCTLQGTPLLSPCRGSSAPRTMMSNLAAACPQIHIVRIFLMVTACDVTEKHDLTRASILLFFTPEFQLATRDSVAW